MLEMWLPMGFVRPEAIGERARQAEADGWDGLEVYDTQCLFGDPFVMMTAAALSTNRLRFSIAASNPVTRHPSVAAAAAASAAAISGNRVRFGVARGDSSLAYVGGTPASVTVFEQYLSAVRGYLRGEAVPFDSISEWRLTQDVAKLHLSHAPPDSRLTWLDPAAPPVPIEVYATGPRVLRVAARWADRVCLAVGADPARLRWAIEIVKAARQDACLDEASLSIMSTVLVGVADDMGRARRSVANMVASSARFAVMGGGVVGPATPAQRLVYEAVARAYDMTQHGLYGSQVDALTDDFIDSHAVVGPVDRCIERIIELTSLGIDSFMLVPPQGDASLDDILSGYRRLVEDVVPAVRAAAETN
jgi:5,10-methylenetetrahydromethanopterin reductase